MVKRWQLAALEALAALTAAGTGLGDAEVNTSELIEGIVPMSALIKFTV